ncbi:hypothetical protein [Halococcoides cellulosivorans]|nr:hypothetical protein [Halococcoides cellulosivorans]
MNRRTFLLGTSSSMIGGLAGCTESAVDCEGRHAENDTGPPRPVGSGPCEDSTAVRIRILNRTTVSRTVEARVLDPTGAELVAEQTELDTCAMWALRTPDPVDGFVDVLDVRAGFQGLIRIERPDEVRGELNYWVVSIDLVPSAAPRLDDRVSYAGPIERPDLVTCFDGNN